MIRVSCPKCEKKLGAEDGAAGTIIACPSCGHKFRIPKAAAAEPSEATNPAKPPAAAKPAGTKSGPRAVVPARKTGPLPAPPGKKPAPQPSPPPKPAEPEEEQGENQQMYAFEQKPEEPKPKKRKHRAGGGDDAADDPMEAQGVGFDKEYLKRLKKKKAKAKAAEWNTADLWLLLLALILIWVGMGALIYFKPEATIVTLALGALVAIIGWGWLLFVTFSESVLWGVLCFFFSPIAGFVFAPLHQGRGIRPSLVCLFGMLIYYTSAFMLAFHLITATPPKGAPAAAPATQPASPSNSQP
jgi:hypothetical protein